MSAQNSVWAMLHRVIISMLICCTGSLSSSWFKYISTVQAISSMFFYIPTILHRHDCTICISYLTTLWVCIYKSPPHLEIMLLLSKWLLSIVFPGSPPCQSVNYLLLFAEDYRRYSLFIILHSSLFESWFPITLWATWVQRRVPNLQTPGNKQKCSAHSKYLINLSKEGIVEGKKRRNMKRLLGGDRDSGSCYLRPIITSFHFIFLKKKRKPTWELCFKSENKGKRKTLEMNRSFVSLDKTLTSIYYSMCKQKRRVLFDETS